MEDKSAALRRKRQERILARKRDRLSSIVQSLNADEIEEPLSSPCKELDVDLSLNLEKLNSAMTQVEPDLDLKSSDLAQSTPIRPARSKKELNSRSHPQSQKDSTVPEQQLLQQDPQETGLLANLLANINGSGAADAAAATAYEFDVFENQVFNFLPRQVNYSALPAILTFYIAGLVIFYLALNSPSLSSGSDTPYSAISNFFLKGPTLNLSSMDFFTNPLLYILLVETPKMAFQAYSSIKPSGLNSNSNSNSTPNSAANLILWIRPLASSSIDSACYFLVLINVFSICLNLF